MRPIQSPDSIASSSAYFGRGLSEPQRISAPGLRRELICTMSDQDLVAAHRPVAIRTRLAAARTHSYLSDTILGAIDGCITTLAIVAGALGAGFSGTIAFILGCANLIADAFSMAVSNYQATLTRHQLRDDAIRTELLHIEHVPDGEREEIRQIFAGKGFDGELLESVVKVVTDNRSLWVETMLKEEYGLQTDLPDPITAGITTFSAFVFVGFFPLLPFLTEQIAKNDLMFVSASLASLVLFGTGVLRGQIVGTARLAAGLHTVLIGSTAAALAWGIGFYLTKILKDSV